VNPTGHNICAFGLDLICAVEWRKPRAERGGDRVGRLLRFKVGKTRRDIDRTLRFVIRAAARNSSGYRRLLDEGGASPDRVRGVEDLRWLPIVDKETLFRRFPLEEVLHRRAAPHRCIRVGTSGSTGLPMNVFMSRAEARFRTLLVLESWRRTARLRLPLVVGDVGSWVEGGETEVRRHGGIGKVVRISIGLPVERQVEEVLRHRPQVLSGYPTALQVLGETFRDVAVSRPFLRLVAVRGEVLHLETRDALEGAFGCRVADYYNSEEMGNMAWECPADPATMHVNTDGCVLEVSDANGDPLPVGAEGRVIVTNLFNCTMPFVRYDLHDRGIILHPGGERCACGSFRPRMAVVQGRDDDFVRLPDGRTVSPRLIATAVNRAFSGRSPLGGFDSHFRRFQVVQDALDHLTIRIVPEPGGSIDFQGVLGSAMRRIHPEFRTSVQLVDGLELEPSGKFRKVISLIERGADET